MDVPETSITGRWFVDSNAPFASDDLTREIRDVDMLPANEIDQELLGHGLPYGAVQLGGARLLPPERYTDDDFTDSFEVEDPFHRTCSVELPQNWAGSLHQRIADSVELALEWWERASSERIASVAPKNAAPPIRVAALLTVVATFVFVVAGVLVGAAAIGSAVRADGPVVPPKSVAAQQDALSRFAVEWATSHRSDMTFSVDDAEAASGEPEPETSAAEERRIARAERAERRRERARRRARSRRR